MSELREDDLDSCPECDQGVIAYDFIILKDKKLQCPKCGYILGLAEEENESTLS
jgi:ribosomal protein S27AE